ncbi:MAG: hypothetical protein DMG59_10845 [Acidobacteria bacterium]|nr:MAG: hypothetical protein DMG59_10845 [Acidobacteriota bacterium]
MLPVDSFVIATRYSVPLAGSITGVPVMPISGTIWPQPRSEAGTVVTPRLLSRKLTCHSGAAFGPALLSASKAYTLSCSVATKTTLWVAFPGIATFDRYSGCAYT